MPKENKVLKRGQIEQVKIKNKDNFLIISYNKLTQNGGLLLFLKSLAAAIGKAALTRGTVH